jgi:uncharacterized lipoprotein YmbA
MTAANAYRYLVLVGTGAFVLLGATGCRSVPTHFYTLMPPPSAEPRAAAATAPLQVEILPVSVPPQVDVPQLVVRRGGEEVVPVDTRRWVAPLSAQLRVVLAADLHDAIGARDVYGLPHAAGAPLYQVQVNVQRFDSVLGGNADIDALWSVTDEADRSRSLTCSSRASVPVGAGYDDLVGGHQRALAEIAQQIGAAVTALQRTAPQGGAKQGSTKQDGTRQDSAQEQRAALPDCPTARR